jgi:glycosyltransferase involved in cell wall biosynthesis
MKIFVVSSFYPPVTTSEALVTYKLFASSRNEYYLCSALNNKWSYNSETKLECKNVHQFAFKVDDFEEFNKLCYEKYLELSKTIQFDAIMTRSMPPEPQEVGIQIKKINKNIPWIVSLADPIGNNPYETIYPLINNKHRLIRNAYSNFPQFTVNNLTKLSKNPYTKKLSKLNKFQEKIVNMCDIVIVPTKEQGQYIFHNDKKFNEKCLVVPHSYDLSLYPKVKNFKNDKFTFAFIGHSDKLRSIEKFIKALKVIKDINPDYLSKIHLRLIGNIPSEIKNMIYVFFLQDVVSVEGTVNYFESLKIMQECDCLIHIDAEFPNLKNNSIFFAAKIVDYLGAKKPIFGMTNPKCPAGRIITSTGGVCCNKQPIDLAKEIIKIVDKGLQFNEDAAKLYDVKVVSKLYDDELERRLHEKK